MSFKHPLQPKLFYEKRKAVSSFPPFPSVWLLCHSLCLSRVTTNSLHTTARMGASLSCYYRCLLEAGDWIQLPN